MCRTWRPRTPRHELQRGQHRRERVAQLVREHGQELVLAAVGLLHLAEEARVVQRQPGAAAELLGHRQVRGRVPPRRRARDQRDRPQRAAARGQRHDHRERRPQAVDEVHRARVRAGLPENRVQRLGAHA
jgi:hypothetical protein